MFHPRVSSCPSQGFDHQSISVERLLSVETMKGFCLIEIPRRLKSSPIASSKSFSEIKGFPPGEGADLLSRHRSACVNVRIDDQKGALPRTDCPSGGIPAC